MTATIPKTPADLQSLVASGELRELHTAKTQGYVSRRGNGAVLPYNGKFGIGYKLLTPRYDSTRYCDVTYYIVSYHSFEGRHNA